jgi:hypothetical protein
MIDDDVDAHNMHEHEQMPGYAMSIVFDAKGNIKAEKEQDDESVNFDEATREFQRQMEQLQRMQEAIFNDEPVDFSEFQ